MKLTRVYLVLVCLVALGACGKDKERGSPPSNGGSSGTLEGSWRTDCITDSTGIYRANVIFFNRSFTSYDSNYVEADCKGASTNGVLTVGIFNSPSSGLIDWTVNGTTTYDRFEFGNGGGTLHFGDKASNGENSRPTNWSTNLYKKQ